MTNSQVKYILKTMLLTNDQIQAIDQVDDLLNYAGKLKPKEDENEVNWEQYSKTSDGVAEDAYYTINGQKIYAKKIMLALNHYTWDEAKWAGVAIAIDYADSKDLFEWEETYYYKEGVMTATKWIEDIQWINGLVEVFETDKNHLTVNKDLTIKAGMKSDEASTMAQARTDGAKTAVSFLSAGSMEANAKSTDSLGVMLEGMHATVAGAANLTAASNTFAEALGYKSGGIQGFSGGKSTMTASIGSSDDKQNVNVVIGKGASLTAHHMNLQALNYGYTESRMDSGSLKSGASISSASPTTSASPAPSTPIATEEDKTKDIELSEIPF